MDAFRRIPLRSKTCEVYLRVNRLYSKKVEKRYSETVILPTTTFPGRIDSRNRVEMDRFIRKECSFDNTLEQQHQQERQKKFVLHDGPPYANGPPHIGHAVNKILKDITNRHKLLCGYKVCYTPGWDCHGLPIELKALAASKSAVNSDDRGSVSDIVSIRTKGRNFAQESIKIQMEAFQRWGVMANWDKCYFTYDKSYVAKQLLLFYELYEKGYILRDFKPVYWSYSTRTALAEAELEYNNNHESKAIYFKCELKSFPAWSRSQKLFAVVWTTTPWSVACNQAICYAPDIRYAIVECSRTGEHFLVAATLKSQLESVLSTTFTSVQEFDGNSLNRCTYVHPINGLECPMLSAGHVTVTKGTGLVHLAPAHGPDDFLVALKYGLPVKCMVDEDCKYTSELGPSLAGKFVLGDGTDEVLRMLGSNLLHAAPYVHSYPYDWRSKKPVILRASLQWFVDTNRIKETAINCLQNVKILPSTARAMMQSQLEKRPYWCISRQRVWGVPIPMFYEADTKKPVLNKPIIDHLVKLLMKHGTDFWWTLPTDQLLPESVRSQAGLSSGKVYERGMDILDIWFDSGSSWKCVLNDQDGVSDVMLEGMDQLGAWFQTTLLTSCASRGKAPYKTLYVHGFTLDEEGRKMSKSIGNVVDPTTITDGGKNTEKYPAYGADVLRWWVAYHATGHTNVPVGPNIIKASSENVHKLRLVLKFLLGVLHQYDPIKESLPLDELLPVDRYMLHCLNRFKKQIVEEYDNFHYNRVCATILNFVTNTVSAFYFHLVKDRLYCDGRNDPKRLSGLTVANHLLETLVHSIAPILPYLAEETFLHHPVHSKSALRVFQTTWAHTNEHFDNPQLANIIDSVLLLQQNLNRELSLKSLNPKYYDLTLHSTDVLLDRLKVLQSETVSFSSSLCEILQTASISLTSAPAGDCPPNSFAFSGSLPFASLVQSADYVSSKNNETDGEHNYSVLLVKSRNFSCPRCRRHLSNTEDHLCRRCSDVIATNR